MASSKAAPASAAPALERPAPMEFHSDGLDRGELRATANPAPARRGRQAPSPRDAEVASARESMLEEAVGSDKVADDAGTTGRRQL